MGWVVLSEEVTSCSVEDFFSGVDVWLRRPQVVNRRLLGAVILREHVLSSQGTCDPEGQWVWAYQLHKELGESIKQGNQLSDSTSEHSDSVISGEEVGEVVSSSPADEGCVTCLVRELLPKMRSVPPKEDAIFLGNECVFCDFIGLAVLYHFPIFMLGADIDVCKYRFLALFPVSLVPRLLLHGEEPGYETIQPKEKNLPCDASRSKS